jgi:hypothetical protein
VRDAFVPGMQHAALFGTGAALAGAVAAWVTFRQLRGMPLCTVDAAGIRKATGGPLAYGSGR